MNEKKEKLAIIMFPNKDFFDRACPLLMSKETFINYYQETLQKRYREKGYKIVFIEHRDEDKKRAISFEQDDIAVNTDFAKHLEDSQSYFAQYDQVAVKIAESLGTDLKTLTDIIVTGFHSFDCCNRMANAIKRTGAPILIDTDLTQLFVERAFNKNPSTNRFEYNKDFKPETYDLDSVRSNIMQDLIKGKYYQNNLTQNDLGVYGFSDEQICNVVSDAKIHESYGRSEYSFSDC